MSYLMAIDAGTGSVRVLIFDTNGKQVSISQREWTHLQENGVENSMGFDFEKNWILTKKSIQEAIKKAGINPDKILGISATSLREGIIVYDKDKTELWGVANVDARAFREVKFLKENYSGIEEEFYKISGQTFALGAIPRLLWLKNNKPYIYEKIQHISMIGDWILYKLSGVIASDPSNAGTTGIFSLKNRDWQRDMASKVGLKSYIFPKVYETGEVIGNVSKKASKECGLSTSTKVIVGGGDVQLGSAALGVLQEGDVGILGGSFWQQVVNIDKDILPPKDMSIRVNPHVEPNLSQAEGISFFSGLVMRWFRDGFCELEKKEADKLGIDAYTLLEKRSKDIPTGSNGVIPIFSDSMKYGKWYHASPSFINLNIDPKVCNRYTLFKALQENACIVSSINLDKIKAFTNIEYKEIVFAGGASKGENWSQILSDVTGYVVKVPTITEATAFGAALSAGVGCGVYSSLSQAIKDFISWDMVYEPNLENKKVYDELKSKWSKIYKEQLKLVDKGLTNPMWKAPGL